MLRFRRVVPRLTPIQWLVAAPFLVLALVCGVLIALFALLTLLLVGLVGGIVLLVRPDLRRRVVAGWRLLRHASGAAQWPPSAGVTEARTVIDYEEQG